MPPQILVEALIGDGDVEPLDYRFFCCSGRAPYVDVIYDRFTDEREGVGDRDYNLVPVWNGQKPDETRVNRPRNYGAMLEVARRLSGGLDVIRIDLYNVRGQVYAGEPMCYPATGRAPFVPRECYSVLGKPWRLVGSGRQVRERTCAPG